MKPEIGSCVCVCVCEADSQPCLKNLEPNLKRKTIALKNYNCGFHPEGTSIM